MPGHVPLLVCLPSTFGCAGVLVGPMSLGVTQSRKPFWKTSYLLRGVSADIRPLAVRVATVVAALGILLWRTPTSFTNPQFWGEDVLFFYGARIDGWASIATLLAG